MSGLGCVAFSVYVLGLVSSPLGVSDLSLRHAAGEGFLLGLDLLSPTWAAKILRTEFLARHRRHAAFRLRRGGARAKSSRYIAPGFVAFAGRGAQKP